ncbi:MAG TPA: peptide-methionine (S)-S-oxide reductase MsrA [Methylomirabilota bacterium]|nr:peptide-methionine (S)-S-oxide reductase MsrA [Methylomirabilota bacterium]
MRATMWIVIASLLLAALVGASVPATAAEPAVVIPAPALDDARAAGPLQTAVLAGGCFWGVQGVYEHVRGVKQVLSGYSGGSKATAEYEVVSRGRTGHAESVQIRFDPKEISYGEILRIYFSVVHDPTQLDQQGPDSGPQYRSNIFYASSTQRKIAQAYIVQLDQAKVFERPIVTRLDPLKAFYPAEEYHQDFLQHNPNHPYIVINDLPKIDNLRKILPTYFREPPISAKGN